MSHPLEDPLYYLDNFTTLLDWVRARYADLLTPGELDLMVRFQGLPVAAQALLVRLVMRKGCYFRASKLAYAEIHGRDEALDELATQDFIQQDPELQLADVFRLCTKRELAACLGKPGAGLKKAEWYAELAPSMPEPRPFSRWCAALEDACVRLQHEDTYTRLRLMFFGNLRQDYADFVLADLGIFNYEKVPFTQASRGFHRREDVDDYLAVHAMREGLEQEGVTWLEREEVRLLMQRPLANEWIEARRQRALMRAAELLQKAGESERSLSIYAICEAEGSRIKYIRLLERKGDIEHALQAALEARRSPASHAERQHLGRVLPRLQRKLGLPVEPAAVAPEVTEYHLELPLTTAVERDAAIALEEPGSQVFYVENTLINSIFGLLCWPAIFAPVSGAFFHPFHTGPADLLRAGFVEKRQALFDECLAAFDNGSYKARILECFDHKQGLQSPFVFWGGIDKALIQTALACIPADHLRRWCEWLLQDIKHNRAGFADLIQFWPEQRRYRMIEVKGPGDRVQDNQRRMMAYCHQHGMPIALCWVRWAETVS